MPLPTNGPVSFRGMPSLGANKKMALTMTFTQKQVEAMFARQAALREQGSSQCPLEIDFNDNKIYIGDVATPFSRVKEDGTREICQRSPTVSKPFAGISLSGNVIGKLNIQRDYDQDIADNIRKLSEAEESKRKERHIVRLDEPLVVPKGKKAKPGSGTSSLAKKAMSNRIVSVQAASNRPSPPSSRSTTPKTSSTVARSTPPSSSVRPTPPSSSRPTPPSSSRPTPPSSSVRPTPPSSSTTLASQTPSPKELDLTSLRAQLIHYVALQPRTTQDVLLKVGGRSPSSELVREIEDTLTDVAEETPQPKNSTGPVMWQLRQHTWEQVRPYEYTPLEPKERKDIARKGRLNLRDREENPMWEHFQTDIKGGLVDIGAETSSSTKGRKKAGSSQPLVKTSNFKGGMFANGKKSSTKGGGVASGGVTKTKAPPATKAKAKKEAEDEVEAKVRKTVAGLAAADAKAKGKAGANPPTTTTTSAPATASKIPKVNVQEVETPFPNAKARASAGGVKEASPLPPKPRQIQDQASGPKRKPVDANTDAGSEMEEGELPGTPEAKKQKLTGFAETSNPRLPIKQSERRETSVSKMGKEKEKVAVKGETAGSVVPKTNGGASSSRPPAGKASRLEREKEREREREKEREERELERLREREREKRRSNGKRRRATPAFSSDEEEEEEKKAPAPPRAPKPKQPARPPASSKPAASAPKPTATAQPRAQAPSPVLPNDRDALRRRYHTYYAQYMGVTSKFHEQRAKVEEALLAGDGDGVSIDEDMDMMDTEQLMQLRGEHERLRDELERIQRAHATVF